MKPPPGDVEVIEVDIATSNDVAQAVNTSGIGIEGVIDDLYSGLLGSTDQASNANETGNVEAIGMNSVLRPNAAYAVDGKTTNVEAIGMNSVLRPNTAYPVDGKTTIEALHSVDGETYAEGTQRAHFSMPDLHSIEGTLSGDLSNISANIAGEMSTFGFGVILKTDGTVGKIVVGNVTEDTKSVHFDASGNFHSAFDVSAVDQMIGNSPDAEGSNEITATGALITLADSNSRYDAYSLTNLATEIANATYKGTKEGEDKFDTAKVVVNGALKTLEVLEALGKDIAD